MSLHTAACAFLMVSLAVTCHAQDANRPPQVIEKLKLLHRETVIVLPPKSRSRCYVSLGTLLLPPLLCHLQ